MTVVVYRISSNRENTPDSFILKQNLGESLLDTNKCSLEGEYKLPEGFEVQKTNYNWSDIFSKEGYRFYLEEGTNHQLTLCGRVGWDFFRISLTKIS